MTKPTRLTMRKWILVVLSLLLLFLPAGCGAAGEGPRQDNAGTPAVSEIDSLFTLEKAEIIRVVDGDTATVLLESGAEEKVRFIGVDTPESTIRHDPYGKEAAGFTKSRLNGRTVYLEKDISDRDKYGRLLRYIWLEPPIEEDNEGEIREKLFNAILLLEGYAQVSTYPPDVKYVDYFKGFQTEARGADKGLWVLDQTTTVYITNSGSKYHRDNCRLLKSRIPISLKDAKARGYEPCKVCKPLEI